jgi:5'-nucleotidase / UDP-sugar diphosphatase
MSNLRLLRKPVTGLLVAGLFVVGAVGTAIAESAKISFLHVNDVYEISAKRGVGGMAQLQSLLKAERAKGHMTVTTLGGDLISPSVMSGLTKGSQMITMMNAIGVDLAGLGNHEFDFGDDVLKKRLSESKFTWLATNTMGSDGKPFGGMDSYAMREVGGYKIGFFSLLTTETGHLSSPGNVKFLDAAETAKNAVAALRKQGANFVVAITHLDLAEDRAIARKTRGLDVILGGHDHDQMMIYEGKTLILKAGYDGHYLAIADLTLSSKEKRGKMRYSFRPEVRMLTTAGVKPDAEIAAIVDGFNKELDASLDVAIGKTSLALDSKRANVRTKETTWGNLIADALKAETGADIGFANGGGIRGDRTYDAGTTLTGSVRNSVSFH